MAMPDTLQALIDSTREIVRADPQHHCRLGDRQQIYQGFVSLCGSSRGRVIRGQLAVMTAQYVLPVWQRAVPLWPPDQDDDTGLDHTRLPEQWLGLAERVLRGAADLATARQEADEAWNIVGNIFTQVFEWQAGARPAAAFACYALDAAQKALYELLGGEPLARLKGWARLTDDELPHFARDTASSAAIAYAGGGSRGEEALPVDIQQRAIFWEWWLTQAIPTTWAIARLG